MTCYACEVANGTVMRSLQTHCEAKEEPSCGLKSMYTVRNFKFQAGVDFFP